MNSLHDSKQSTISSSWNLDTIHFNQVLAQNPDNKEALAHFRQLGQTEFAQEDFPPAITHLTRARAFSLADLATHLLLQKAFREERHLEDKRSRKDSERHLNAYHFYQSWKNKLSEIQIILSGYSSTQMQKVTDFKNRIERKMAELESIYESKPRHSKTMTNWTVRRLSNSYKGSREDQSHVLLNTTLEKDRQTLIDIQSIYASLPSNQEGVSERASELREADELLKELDLQLDLKKHLTSMLQIQTSFSSYSLIREVDLIRIQKETRAWLDLYSKLTDAERKRLESAKESIEEILNASLINSSRLRELSSLGSQLALRAIVQKDSNGRLKKKHYSSINEDLHDLFTPHMREKVISLTLTGWDHFKRKWISYYSSRAVPTFSFPDSLCFFKHTFYQIDNSKTLRIKEVSSWLNECITRYGTIQTIEKRLQISFS